MERIKTLLTRFGRTIFLFVIGIIVIVYLSLGALYLQQAPQQQALNEQIIKMNAILKNPLPSINQLNAAYDAVNQKLAPLSDNFTIAMLVGLASEQGIDISEENGKFQVPVPDHGETSLGGVSYRMTSFRNIRVQGDNAKVLAFVSILDSGSRLPNMVMIRLSTQEVVVTVTGAEAERRSEFRTISQAVKDMMADNRIIRLPNPLSAARGKASNKMGDDPETLGIFEGFPDILTTAAQKGYTGNATPRNGYLLWEHDKINSDNKSLYTSTNYTSSLNTTYYYTAEEDGNVRQWSSPNTAGATEYPDSSPSKMELLATMDLNIYFRAK